MKNDIFVVEKTKLEEVECEFEEATFYRVEGQLGNFPISGIKCIKRYHKSQPEVEILDGLGSVYYLSQIKFFKTVPEEPENSYSLNLNHSTLCKIQAILSTMRWYNNDTMDSELKELSEHIEEVTGLDYYKTEYAFAKIDDNGDWTEVVDAFVVHDNQFYAR